MSQARYDALIFDLDGTLWDSCETCAQGWNVVLAPMGTAVTADQIRSVAGRPFEDCIRALLPQPDFPLDAAMLRAIDRQQRTHTEQLGGRLFEGVAAGIAELTQHYPLFLVSNCQDWYLDCFWQHSGLKDHFEGWDCHGLSQLPKAEMIRNLVDHHGLLRPVYIGDTEGDRTAAVGADVDYAHVAWGFARVAGASMNFRSFAELTRWFQR